MFNIRKAIATILATFTLGGSLIGCGSKHEVQYTVDRVEVGANGEQWVVVEVYDVTADTLEYIDIKVDEGYQVTNRW